MKMEGLLLSKRLRASRVRLRFSLPENRTVTLRACVHQVAQALAAAAFVLLNSSPPPHFLCFFVPNQSGTLDRDSAPVSIM